MPMSAEHKAALAQGRKEARAIKPYLEALNTRGPGRPVTRKSLESRLQAVTNRLSDESNPLKKVELLQKGIDFEAEIADFEDAVKIGELETAFVEHARPIQNARESAIRLGVSLACQLPF